MKAMGVRVGRQRTRVAIVRRDKDGYTLLNSDAASRLAYPADLTGPDDRVLWLFDEMERLHHENPDLDVVCIKTNEYGADTKAKRESAYLEAATMLSSRRHSVPVTSRTYVSLATRKANVKAHAEQRVKRTDKYWDTQMADAIVAAWKGLQS